MAAKAKPKSNHRTVWIMVAVAVAVLGYLWWRKRQQSAAQAPLYVATPTTPVGTGTYGSPYYGSSSSGAGFVPSQPYGTNTPTTPVAQMPIEVGNGGLQLQPLPNPPGTTPHPVIG